MASPSDRIPVSIVTGFLGAGKSTLLNRLLRDPEMRDTAVIINEFGEVGIDHLLVESSGDAMIELSNGCLCCTVRGELTDTLASLRQDVGTGRVKALRRVVIETSGLVDHRCGGNFPRLFGRWRDHAGRCGERPLHPRSS